MKNRIAVIVVAVCLLLFHTVLPCVAESEFLAKATLDNGLGPYYTNLIKAEEDRTLTKDGMSLAVQPFTGGSFGFDTDGNTLPNGKNAKGTRRSMLYPLSATVPAGDYTVSVWIGDPNGVLTDKTADFALMISFHDGSLPDELLCSQWNNSTCTKGILQVIDLHDHVGKPITAGKTHWDAYTGSKSSMEPTGNTQKVEGIVWREYSGTATLTGDCAKTAVWLYQWAGYDNNKASAPFYVDEIGLKKATPVVPDVEDDTEIEGSPDALAAVNYKTVVLVLGVFLVSLALVELLITLAAKLLRKKGNPPSL